jgi:putative ubiquitin-RnfH superfamily antitoxin RatB of RatAB toxin-antitoxin module
MALDTAALRGELDRAVGEYAATVAGERVTVEAGMVTAVLGLDGVLHELVVDPRALRRHGLDGIGERIAEVIRAAEREAASRRDVLAGKVTFLGHPVLEVVREMISDPEAAARRLAADADRGRYR